MSMASAISNLRLLSFVPGAVLAFYLLKKPYSWFYRLSGGVSMLASSEVTNIHLCFRNLTNWLDSFSEWGRLRCRSKSVNKWYWSHEKNKNKWPWSVRPLVYALFAAGRKEKIQWKVRRKRPRKQQNTIQKYWLKQDKFNNIESETQL